MNGRFLRRGGTGLFYALPLLFLAFFFFYPLGAILVRSLNTDDGQAGNLLAQTLASASFWRLLWFTTWQAAVSTALTLAAGLPLAYLFGRYDFPAKTLLRSLATLPFVMPTVVVAVAFTTLLGEQGMLNQWLRASLALTQPPIRLSQTIWLILLVHVFYNVSIVVRTVGGFWSNMNPRLEEAAAVLGANRRRVFGDITWPLLIPSIIAASLLIFLFCFTSFGVVMILGGARFATIEVEIYRQAVSFFNLRLAAVLCLAQIALSLGVMTVYTRLQARMSIPLELRPERINLTLLASSPWRRGIASGVLIFLLFLLAPLITLALRSFSLGDQGWTMRYYWALTENPRQSAFFFPPLSAVGNSLWIASVTTLLSLLLGLAAAYLLVQRQGWLSVILDPLFLLPLGSSAVTLGFGYIVTMGSLRASPWLTPIAHTLIAMPFVVRTLLPALRRIDPKLRQAAMVLGAPPARLWREIDAPLLWRTVVVGAVFAFAISLGEFGATLLVGRPEQPTMPMVIYQALSKPGLLNYGQALAMSTILMVVCVVALVVIERLRLPGEDF